MSDRIPRPLASPGTPVNPDDGTDSGVREFTAREARLKMEAWGEKIRRDEELKHEDVAAKARLDSLRMLVGSIVGAIAIAFVVFFTLDSRAESKDAGVAAQAAKDLSVETRRNDKQDAQIEKQGETLQRTAMKVDRLELMAEMQLRAQGIRPPPKLDGGR